MIAAFSSTKKAEICTFTYYEFPYIIIVYLRNTTVIIYGFWKLQYIPRTMHTIRDLFVRTLVTDYVYGATCTIWSQVHVSETRWW